MKVNYTNPFLTQFINKNNHLLKYPEVDPKLKANKNKTNQSVLGEIKSIEAKKKTRLLCLDLYRLLHFSKDIVGNKNGCDPILTFQSVGRKITFYIYTQIGESFCLMTELFSLKIPTNVDEISH
jgi:hypothetical protein